MLLLHLFKRREILKFGLNLNSNSFTFYDRNSDPIRVASNCAVRLSAFAKPSKYLTPIGSFVNQMKRRGIKKFYLERTSALGDVLMTVPVIRHLKAEGFEPYLRTSRRWLPILEKLEVETQAIELTGALNFGILLDGTVELDHVSMKMRKYHRVEIFFKCLGMNTPRELDWSSNFNKFPSVVDTPNPYVVFQGKGTTAKKWLPNATIQCLINRMNDKGINVVYVGNAIGRTNECIQVNRERNKLAFMQYNLPQLFSLIAGAKCVVTMDSAPLWISHFTKTPAIAILGPTRAEQRISKHPLYPEGAAALKLYDLVNCEPCFEAAGKCNHKLHCLYVKPQRMWDNLEPLVTKFWKN